MSATSFRRLADTCRRIPSAFGLREHTVALVVTQTTGSLPWSDEGGRETVTPITVYGGASPKVSFPTQREISLGMMSEGSVTVGPFTPDYGTGGVDRDLFTGSQLSTGDGYAIRITGPQHPKGCSYRVKNCNVDHALRVTLICVPVEGS